MKTHPKYFPVLEREITRMEKILKDGLPSCYRNFLHFTSDYWPEFSWTPSVAIYQVNELLESPVWAGLAKEIKQVHGHDFVKELNEGLVELKKD